MAKLSAFYRLCPLIDHRNFLGVSDDSVSGCVIVTLGKNIVIRYKLSDQKQVSSWSSKDKLSAPVVYDRVGERYVGLFNSNQLCLWADSLAQIDKLKKYKFVRSLHCVLSAGVHDEPVVIYRDGTALSLTRALDRRKQPSALHSPLSPEHAITDCSLVEEGRVALFTHDSSKRSWLHLVTIGKDSPGELSLHLQRDGVTLSGHAIISSNALHLITLWSDNALYSLELTVGSTGASSPVAPGRLLTRLACVDAKHPAAMLALSSTQIALYAAHPSQEGAVLLVFSVQFSLVQCQLQLKLYSSPPRLWATAPASDLLFVDGQHLLVTPFSLATQKLSSLVGTHAMLHISVSEAVDWGVAGMMQLSPQEDHCGEHLSDIHQKFNEYTAQGLSQAMICTVLLPMLLSARDTAGAVWLYSHVCDVPEPCVVATLAQCLASPDYRPYPLLSAALSILPLGDASTLALLRSSFPLPKALTLLAHITDALIDSPAHPALLQWATVLLDAHYQQYLLSSGDSEVLDRLTELRNVVENQLEYMHMLQSLSPLLAQLQSGRLIPQKRQINSKMYAIEMLRLY